MPERRFANLYASLIVIYMRAQYWQLLRGLMNLWYANLQIVLHVMICHACAQYTLVWAAFFGVVQPTWMQIGSILALLRIDKITYKPPCLLSKRSYPPPPSFRATYNPLANLLPSRIAVNNQCANLRIAKEINPPPHLVPLETASPHGYLLLNN